MLRRYYSADRTPYSDYNGKVEKYYTNKPQRIPRDKGLAQGGIISGLLSNLFLHELDLYVQNTLKEKYQDILYFRYADDFIFLFKNKKDILDLYEDVKVFMWDMLKLKLHDIGKKTKLVIMTAREYIDFLGFKITPERITINDANINRFKNRIQDILSSYKPSDDHEKSLKHLAYRINFKIMGSQAFHKVFCPICQKIYKHRSWLSYFLIITDVWILKILDKWIKQQIYWLFYTQENIRLSKGSMKNCGLVSLEQLYYTHKSKNFDE